MVKLTDPAFFKIYSFQFLEGSPFTASDLASGISTAVVTDDLARRLFGTTEEVVGRSFSLNYIDYRVCGVVRSASYLTSKSYAQLYVPYTVSPDYSSPKYNLPYLGAFSATFLVKDGKQGDALRAEIKEICRKENLMHPDEWQVDFWEHLYRYLRPLVEGGFVYAAQPPLYLLKHGKDEYYCYSDEELDDLKTKIGEGSKYSIQRYKGLGEMNAEQLWETTMDPEKRILNQIDLDEAMEADMIFDMLMGEKVEPRREFIQENAKYVTDLDI